MVVQTQIVTRAASEARARKRVFSGIQPTGTPHIGNYLGAIQRWARQQDARDSIFSIVDLHAMSMPYDPDDLRNRTLGLAAALVACGIDPERSILFAQSQVPEHTELMWILSTQTMFGELSRMTQFKDKSKGSERVGAALFLYPVLQAADIILYDTDLVPVGEDQRQHIELTRDIATRFNRTFGETFVVPEADILPEGARIMGLDDASVKMSKSASAANYIALSDTPDEIRRKVSRAVTDSGSEIVARADKPELTNLLTIYSLFTGVPVSELEERYRGSGYGQFKKDLGEAIVEQLAPIQARLAELSSDPGELTRLLARGAERARELATPKMERVRAATGLSLA